MADKKDKPDKAEQAAKAEQSLKTDAAAKAKREGKARQAQQKQAAEEAKASAAAPLPPEPKLPARLRVRFENEIAPALMKELKIDNKMRVPRLQKITINMALQEARDNVKILDSALEELKVIAGQKPVLTRARKAISNFKLRQGMPIGVMVTLRREKMWEFFDRLVNISLPRVRDFRGVSDKAFDGRGNYSLGLKEHTIFPELNLDKVEKVKGLTISITTTARSDFEGLTLLRALGMPMRGAAERERTRPKQRRQRRRMRQRGLRSRQRQLRRRRRRRREHKDSDGENVPAGQSDSQTKIQSAPVQPLPAMRPRARVLSAFQDVQAVPAQVCTRRQVAGRYQGELVEETNYVADRSDCRTAHANPQRDARAVQRTDAAAFTAARGDLPRADGRGLFERSRSWRRSAQENAGAQAALLAYARVGHSRNRSHQQAE